MPAVAENRSLLKDAGGAQIIFAEQTTGVIVATLVDEVGAAIPAAALTALTLTLYNRDSATQEIINSVNGVDILNTGRGTVHASSGLMTITLQPDDNSVVDNTQDLEWHRALITGTYGVNNNVFRYELEFRVRNLAKVS